MLIKAHQVVPYNNAAKQLEKVAELISSVNVAGLDQVDVQAITDLYGRVVALRSDMHSKAHARYVAERAGDVNPGE